MNGDLISREALKKKIDKFIGLLDEDMIYRLKVAIDKVPAVKPTFGVFREMLCSECEKNCTECKEKRPKGEWIKADNLYDTVVCNKCGGIRRDNRIDHIAFCNKCGVDMRKGGAE